MYLITRKTKNYAHAHLAQHIRAPISVATYFAPEEKPQKKLQPQAAIALVAQLQQNTG